MLPKVALVAGPPSPVGDPEVPVPATVVIIPVFKLMHLILPACENETYKRLFGESSANPNGDLITAVVA